MSHRAWNTHLHGKARSTKPWVFRCLTAQSGAPPPPPPPRTLTHSCVSHRPIQSLTHPHHGFFTHSQPHSHTHSLAHSTGAAWTSSCTERCLSVGSFAAPQYCFAAVTHWCGSRMTAQDAASLRVAERRKRAAHPKLSTGGWQQLVVLASKVGRRCNASVSVPGELRQLPARQCQSFHTHVARMNPANTLPSDGTARW